jgi:release factor glutamine methyltransferase
MNSILSILTAAYDTLQHTSESARLDAEILLCTILEKDRTFLRAWPERVLSQEQQDSFQVLLKKRIQGYPIAYLTGHKEFWSRDFIVNHHVLVPRPETELLVELALDLIPDNRTGTVLDLGTGSGAIGITIAAERPNIKVMAIDVSQQALEVANANAQQHKIENIQFLHSHWFKQLYSHQFDLILSNPPYIDVTDPHLKQGDVRFEPENALIAKQNGLQDIMEIAEVARHHLLPNGYLLVEHGYNQKQPVQSIFQQLNYTNITNYCDLAGQPRVTLGQWQA